MPSVDVLDPIDSLLSVGLHLAQHRYRVQLKWLVDVAEVARYYEPAIDWDEFWRRTQELGALRAMTYVFVLAKELLQAPLPQV